MGYGEFLRDHFPYGPEAWVGLQTSVKIFCHARREGCSGCPLNGAKVSESDISAVCPSNPVEKDCVMPLCNRFATFAHPEEAAAIVGFRLPELRNSSESNLLQSSISFSGLFPNE
jgi:hypothetical protein